jgi:hypothetical protein
MEDRGIAIAREWPKPRQGFMTRLRLTAAAPVGSAGSALARQLNRKTVRDAR